MDCERSRRLRALGRRERTGHLESISAKRRGGESGRSPGIRDRGPAGILQQPTPPSSCSKTSSVSHGTSSRGRAILQRNPEEGLGETSSCSWEWHVPGKASGFPGDPEATRAQPRHHPLSLEEPREIPVTTMLGHEVGTHAPDPFLQLGTLRLR